MSVQVGNSAGNGIYAYYRQIQRQPGTNNVFALVQDVQEPRTGSNINWGYRLFMSSDGGKTWSSKATLPSQSNISPDNTNMTQAVMAVESDGTVHVLYVEHSFVQGVNYQYLLNYTQYNSSGNSFVHSNIYNTQSDQISGVSMCLDNNNAVWFVMGWNSMSPMLGSIAKGATTATISSDPTARAGYNFLECYWDSNVKGVVAVEFHAGYFWLVQAVPSSQLNPSASNWNFSASALSPTSVNMSLHPYTNGTDYLVAYSAPNSTAVTFERVSNNGTVISTFTVPGAPANISSLAVCTDGTNTFIFANLSDGTLWYTKNNSAWVEVETGGATYFTISSLNNFNVKSTNYLDFMYTQSNGSGAGYPWYYDQWANNQPPNAPSFFNISSSGSTINTKPKMFGNVSDPDSGNTIQNAEIQISTSNTFSPLTQDVQYGNDSGYGTQTAGWTGLPTPNNSTNSIKWTPQTALAPGTYYMRCRCKDNNGAWSNWSATQQFTVATVPWSDTPVAGYPGMKAQWLNDLASAINNARQFRGIATFAFTDGTVTALSTDIKAIHISERRQKLIDVLNVVSVTWNPAAVSNSSDRDGQHIIDLRSYAAQT